MGFVFDIHLACEYTEICTIIPAIKKKYSEEKYYCKCNMCKETPAHMHYMWSYKLSVVLLTAKLLCSLEQQK